MRDLAEMVVATGIVVQLLMVPLSIIENKADSLLCGQLSAYLYGLHGSYGA